MKRILIIAAAAIALNGCAIVNQMHHKGASRNPYEQPLFYTKYLDPANPLDQQIHQDLIGLRANPASPQLHNDLGQLLARKGFPKDAELEFERAVNSDAHFYPGWYNLGLMRSARGDAMGARFAFSRTLHYKPGHSEALFQMGLIEERRDNEAAAIDYYSKAFLLNHDLLDVKVNPRIVDSKLVDIALLKAYPQEHTRESMQFLGSPQDYGRKPTAAPPVAVSPQAPAADIVTPAAPVTDPSQQTPPPTVPPPPGL